MDKVDTQLAELEKPFVVDVDGEEWTIKTLESPDRCGTMTSENHKCGSIVSCGRFQASFGERTVEFRSYCGSVNCIQTEFRNNLKLKKQALKKLSREEMVSLSDLGVQWEDIKDQ